MVAAALERLAGKENFILQVEGGRVDHAAHGSDAAAMILDQLALDEAIELILEFQRKNPDTLVVMTTDHGNSNPGLNGMGGGYTRSPMRLGNIQKFRASTGNLLNHIKARGQKIPVTPFSMGDPDERVFYELPKVVHFYADEEAEDKLIKAEEEARKAKEAGQKKKPEVQYGQYVAEKDIIEVVEQYTGYRMPKERATIFQRILLRRGEALFDQLNNEGAQLGQLLANYTGVNFIGTSHTSDYVPVVAVGPGAERFNGLIQNTEVFTHYTEMAGIRFKNPCVPILSDADAAGNFPRTEDIAAYSEPCGEPVV
jgi:alkaline phosphatase